VEFSRLTRGIALLSILLASASFFFDSFIGLVAAAALMFSLAWRYEVFDRTVRDILVSCSVRRELDKSIVRQGSSVSVLSTFAIAPFPGMRAEVTDLLPQGGVLHQGSAGPLPVIEGKCTLSYEVALKVHGDSLFPGLMMTLTDRFFSDEYRLTALAFQGPGVAVQPASEFESSFGLHGYGEDEIERIRAISGHSIRGFRDFQQGDDMKHIDWKLTAKHGRFVIREFANLSGSYPLLVLDLPELSPSGDKGRFEAMVEAAAGAVERSVKEYRRISLLLISGPNIVKMYPAEKRVQNVMQVMRREMHPVSRQRSLYRFLSYGDLASLSATAERLSVFPERTEERAFLASVAKVFKMSADTGELHAFQAEIARAIMTAEYDDVLLFSLCEGDTSHIRVLVDQVHQRKKQVHLHVPISPGGPQIREHRAAFRADSVEAIPCG